MTIKSDEKYLPVMLNVTDKKVLVIGAGKACAEKLHSLGQIKPDVTVIAEKIDPVFRENPWMKIIEKRYQPGDMDRFDLVYCGINDPETEKEIQKEAHQKRILINFIDQRSLSDFISPSVIQRENFSVFISTFGKGPGATKQIRKTIESSLDLDQLNRLTGEYIEKRKQKLSD